MPQPDTEQPVPTVNDLLANHAVRLANGQITGAERQVYDLAPDREKAVETDAVTAYLASRLDLDPTAVSQDLPFYTKAFFGRSMDAHAALTAARIIDPRMSPPAGYADEPKGRGTRLAHLDPGWPALDNWLADRIKPTPEKPTVNRFIGPNGIEEREIKYDPTGFLEQTGRVLVRGTLGMGLTSAAGVLSLTNNAKGRWNPITGVFGPTKLPKTALALAERSNAVRTANQPNAADLKKLQEVSGHLKAAWSPVWWREVLGEQVPYTVGFVAGGWAIDSMNVAGLLVRVWPKLAGTRWLLAGSDVLAKAAILGGLGEGAMNAGQAMAESMQKSEDTLNVMQDYIKKLTPEQADAIYTNSFQSGVETAKFINSKTHDPEIAGAMGAAVYRRNIALNTLTDAVTFGLAGGEKRLLRRMTWLRGSRKTLLAGLSARYFDTYAQVYQELRQNDVQKEEYYRHVLGQNLDIGLMDTSIMRALTGDDPEAFDTALATIFMSGRSFLLGSASDIVQSRSQAVAEGKAFSVREAFLAKTQHHLDAGGTLQPHEQELRDTLLKEKSPMGIARALVTAGKAEFDAEYQKQQQAEQESAIQSEAVAVSDQDFINEMVEDGIPRAEAQADVAEMYSLENVPEPQARPREPKATPEKKPVAVAETTAQQMVVDGILGPKGKIRLTKAQWKEAKANGLMRPGRLTQSKTQGMPIDEVADAVNREMPGANLDGNEVLDVLDFVFSPPPKLPGSEMQGPPMPPSDLRLGAILPDGRMVIDQQTDPNTGEPITTVAGQDGKAQVLPQESNIFPEDITHEATPAQLAERQTLAGIEPHAEEPYDLPEGGISYTPIDSDDIPFSVGGGQVGPGVPMDVARRALQGLPPELVADAELVEEMPEDARAAAVRAGRQDAADTAYGYYDAARKKKVVIAGRVPDVATLLSAAVHEAMHRNLHEGLGAARTSILESIGKLIPDEEIDRVLPPGYAGLDHAGRVAEYLARLSESVIRGKRLQMTERTIWQRILDWFRDLVGIKRNKSLEELAPDPAVAAFVRDVLRANPARRPSNLAPAGPNAQTAYSVPPPSLEQRQTTTAGAVARILMGRMQQGKNVQISDARRLLKRVGMQDRAAEVFQAAASAHWAFNEAQDRKKAHPEINRAIADQEVRRAYRTVLDESRRLGFDEARLSAQGEQVYRERRLASSKAELAKRRGLSAQDLTAMPTKSGKPVDLVATLLKAIDTDDQETVDAAWTFTDANIKAGVRQKLIDEGVFTPKKKTYERDPAFKREYQQSVKNLLTALRVNNLKHEASQALKLRIREYMLFQTWPAIEGHARQLATQLAQAAVKQDKKTLLGKVRDFLKVNAIAKRQKSNTTREKLEMDRRQYSTLHAVRMLSEMSGQQAEELIRLVAEGINNQKAQAPEWWAPMYETYAALKTPWVQGIDHGARALWLLATAQQYAGMKDRFTRGQIADRLDSLRETKAAGEVAVAERAAEREARNEPERKVILDALSPKNKPHESNIRKAFNAFAGVQIDFRGFLRYLASYGTEEDIAAVNDFARVMGGRISEANMIRDNYVRTWQGKFEHFLEDLVGKKQVLTYQADLLRGDPALARFATNPNVVKDLSRAQLLNLLAHYEQPDYADRVPEKWGSADAWIAEAKKVLQPEDLALLDWLRDSLLEMGEDMSPVTMKVLGFGIPEQALYFPGTMVQLEDRAEEVHKTTGTVPPLLIQRRFNELRVDDDADVLSIFRNHYGAVGHFVAFADLNQDILSIFARNDVQGRIRDIFGRSFLSKFKAKYSNIVTGGSGIEVALPGWARIRGLLMFAWFSGNVGVGIRQLSSGTTTAVEIGLKGVSDAWKSVLTPEGQARLREVARSDYVTNRMWRGMTEPFAQSARAARNTRILRSLGFMKLPMQLGDLAPLMVLVQHVYGNLTEYYSGTYSEPEAKRRALREAWSTVTETQQSSQTEMLNFIQTNMGELGRWFNSLLSTQQQKLNYELTAISQLWAVLEKIKHAPNGPERAKLYAEAKIRGRRLKNVVLYFHAIDPMLFGLFAILARGAYGDYVGSGKNRDLGKRDLKELFMLAVLGPWTGALLLGYLLKWGLGEFMGGNKYVYSEALPMVGATRRFVVTNADLIRHIATGDAKHLASDLEHIASQVAPPANMARHWKNAYLAKKKEQAKK